MPSFDFDDVNAAAGAGGGVSHVPDTVDQYGSKKVMNKIVDRPWEKGNKHYTPGPELRREIQTGVTEQVGVSSITFAMNADDCNSGFKRIDDTNVTAPYIGCRETFRFVTKQAIARCEQLVNETVSVVRSECNSVVRAAKLNLDYRSAQREGCSGSALEGVSSGGGTK